MKVKLTESIFEADRFGNMTLKVTQRPKRGIVIAWTAGTEIDMSEASAAKYVEQGRAVKVEEPKA